MKAVELYDHQLDAVKKLDNGKILTGGVGTGKGHVALRYYIEKEAPKDVYVITTAKKRDSLDWEREAIQHGIGRETSVPVDGKAVGHVLVDSWNNIGKYVDVQNAFFIFDEQRLVGSGAWVKMFYKIAKKNHWILLSATPGDTWLDYIPVFVANGLYKNRTEFLREHVVFSRFSKFPKVEKFIGVGRLVRHRNKLLVEMPYTRHTTREIKETIVDYDQDLFKRVMVDRWHVYEERPLRDVAELFSVMRRVVNSSPSRLTEIQELLKTHPRLIVFYNFDYELEILRTLTSTNITEECKNLGHNFSVAEWNGHKHEDIPNTDSWVYLVQYRAGAEGWNCTATDTVVFYSLTYSYRDYEQSQGRIDRLNTPYYRLFYYVLRTNSWIDKRIWKTLQLKQDFNEKSAAKELVG